MCRKSCINGSECRWGEFGVHRSSLCPFHKAVTCAGEGQLLDFLAGIVLVFLSQRTNGLGISLLSSSWAACCIVKSWHLWVSIAVFNPILSILQLDVRAPRFWKVKFWVVSITFYLFVWEIRSWFWGILARSYWKSDSWPYLVYVYVFCILRLKLLKHSQMPNRKQAIIFGLMNPAKMESTVIYKSTATTEAAFSGKDHSIAGYEVMLRKVCIPGGAVVQFLSFCPFWVSREVCCCHPGLFGLVLVLS